MEQAVDLVTGWMLGAKITVPEYGREYPGRAAQLEMGKGQPDRQFYYLSAMNRYHVSPARVPVIGYQEVIQRLTRDDVYNYYKMAYQPNNMVFVGGGGFRPEAMLKAVQKNVTCTRRAGFLAQYRGGAAGADAAHVWWRRFPSSARRIGELGFRRRKWIFPTCTRWIFWRPFWASGESSIMVRGNRDNDNNLSAEISCQRRHARPMCGTFTVEHAVGCRQGLDTATQGRAWICSISSKTQQRSNEDRIRPGQNAKCGWHGSEVDAGGGGYLDIIGR